MPALSFHNNAREGSRKGTVFASSLHYTINSMQIRLLKKRSRAPGHQSRADRLCQWNIKIQIIIKLGQCWGHINKTVVKVQKKGGE